MKIEVEVTQGSWECSRISFVSKEKKKCQRSPNFGIPKFLGFWSLEILKGFGREKISSSMSRSCRRLAGCESGVQSPYNEGPGYSSELIEELRHFLFIGLRDD